MNLDAKYNSGYVDIPGGRTWYEVHGSDQPGIPLIALHGGPGCPHSYLEPLALLSSERPVVLYDQIGCGNSSLHDEHIIWNPDIFIQELICLINHFGYSKVSLMGQSWGSMLAAMFYQQYPSKIHRMVFSGPFLSAPRFIQDCRLWLEELPQNIKDDINSAEENHSYDSEKYLQAMDIFYRRHICRTSEWPKTLNESFANMGLDVYLEMWGPSEFTCTGILQNIDLTDQLHNIDVPVLITNGEYDEVRIDTAEYYRSLIPQAQLLIFKNSAHEHHLECQDEYIKSIRDFLK